ncbi:hypothetical protein [Nostoc sp. DedQUE09]|uniref:hypothetical protein n=1 Tax=Nostoc sp. DedQUE09 TaxID=3075394 RepID=UPI002AD3A741|nr:hypothetical protein [Nostoc sp. DedQUE09]MDZ7950345.1 hypothetical protein [Nostoc sp. DedQUE09]
MNHLINELFVKIKSDDERVRSNAITDISFILEINSWQLPLEKRMSRYHGLIKQELININLADNEEAEIVEFLQREIIDSNKLKSSLLFTIGKASSKTGLILLLDIIQNYSSEFNANESYQTLVSLERLLFWDYHGLSDEEKRNIVSQTNPTPFIESKLAWALNNPNSPHSSELQHNAERLLGGLSQLLKKTNE